MRTQTNKCPICRAPVKKLLTIHLSPSELAGNQKLTTQSLSDGPLKNKADEDYDDKEDELLSRHPRDKV